MPLRLFVYRDLDLFFQGHLNLKSWYLGNGESERKMLNTDFHIDWYSLLKRTIANVVLRKPYLNFHRLSEKGWWILFLVDVPCKYAVWWPKIKLDLLDFLKFLNIHKNACFFYFCVKDKKILNFFGCFAHPKTHRPSETIDRVRQSTEWDNWPNETIDRVRIDRVRQLTEWDNWPSETIDRVRQLKLLYSSSCVIKIHSELT